MHRLVVVAVVITAAVIVAAGVVVPAAVIVVAAVPAVTAAFLTLSKGADNEHTGLGMEGTACS